MNSTPRFLSPLRGQGIVGPSRSCRLASLQCRAQRRSPAQSRRHWSSAASSSLRGILKISDEVADAVATDKPVVALESTIYTHGAMGRGLAAEHEQLIRSHGGIPAIIAVVDGVPTVGATSQDIARMTDAEGTRKVSRRDISYLAGMGIAGRKLHGGTTISGTMVLARLAGIRVFGTGGLGGVHRGGENSMDVSADLTELGRTRVAVISSGCKGFLDIPRTLEFLETQGALVSTFADGRHGKVDFPGFWARETGIESPSVVYTEREAASMILSQERLNIESGLLLANPIPEEFAIPLPDIRSAIEQATSEANEKGFSGKDNTPYVLGRIKELTGERAYVANLALVKSNLIRATKVAIELSQLLSPSSQHQPSLNSYNVPSSSSAPTPAPAHSTSPKASVSRETTDIMVAGSVAVDLSCDYASMSKAGTSPQLNTSNPATIRQSIGGVGHNVALAAHRASGPGRVAFCSLVGDDIAGSTVLSSLEAEGLDTTYVRRLGPDYQPANRTAQYVAVNDGDRNLVMAMADMGIFSNNSFNSYWKTAVQETNPKWLVVDGNWSPKDILSWIQMGKDQGCKIAFEPVSVEKSVGLFPPLRGRQPQGVFPRANVDMASPNTYELEAMYSAAKDNGYLDTTEWFGVIDAFGMRGARERFVYLTSRELTDLGVPVQSVQLLPYIPTIVTKLGADGVLLTSVLGRDDPRLFASESQQYILARATDHPTIGGVYMRLFPPAEKVEDAVSVNGVGDTFLGVLISGLAKGGSVEQLVHVAQQGAVMSLRSEEAVSPEVSRLVNAVGQAIR